jgi:hypothetical protein
LNLAARVINDRHVKILVVSRCAKAPA